MSALMMALSQSDQMVQMVELLINFKGIDINQTDGGGRNALMWLCWFSKSDKILEVAQLLVAKGD